MSAEAGCLPADAAGLRGAAPTAAAVPKALHESINHTYAELLHRFDTLLLEGAQLLGMSERELQKIALLVDEINPSPNWDAASDHNQGLIARQVAALH